MRVVIRYAILRITQRKHYLHKMCLCLYLIYEKVWSPNLTRKFEQSMGPSVSHILFTNVFRLLQTLASHHTVRIISYNMCFRAVVVVHLFVKCIWSHALFQISSVMWVCFRFWFNPELLQVVDTSLMPIEVGDYVVVTNSIKELKTLQDERHGGWNHEMRKV